MSIFFTGDYGRDEDKHGSTTRVYARMRCCVTVRDKQVTRTIFFSRHNYDEKWIELCDKMAALMEWKKPPSHYLKAKPKFNDVLKQCGVVESRTTDKRKALVYDVVAP